MHDRRKGLRLLSERGIRVSRPAIEMGAFRAVLLAVSASGAVGAALHRAGIFDQLPIHKPLRSIKSRLNRKQKVIVSRTARVTPVRPAAEGARLLWAYKMITQSPRRRCCRLPCRSRQVSRRSATASHAAAFGFCPSTLLIMQSFHAQARRRAVSPCSPQSIRWYARIAAGLYLIPILSQSLAEPRIARSMRRRASNAVGLCRPC